MSNFIILYIYLYSFFLNIQYRIDDMINKLFTKKKSTKKAVPTASNNLKIEKTKNMIKINNIEVKDGACKHFKKSHRLFKFPCCNKVRHYKKEEKNLCRNILFFFIMKNNNFFTTFNMNNDNYIYIFIFFFCVQIFPCPTCHDLNSNHECDIAKRVICGFCYREFSDDEVCICQRDKKLKKGGKFWEVSKYILINKKEKNAQLCTKYYIYI